MSFPVMPLTRVNFYDQPSVKRPVLCDDAHGVCFVLSFAAPGNGGFDYLYDAGSVPRRGITSGWSTTATVMRVYDWFRHIQPFRFSGGRGSPAAVGTFFCARDGLKNSSILPRCLM
jgi:hypothetical protein